MWRKPFFMMQHKTDKKGRMKSGSSCALWTEIDQEWGGPAGESRQEGRSHGIPIFIGVNGSLQNEYKGRPGIRLLERNSHAARNRCPDAFAVDTPLELPVYSRTKNKDIIVS
jgi:hypothetical protein